MINILVKHEHLCNQLLPFLKICVNGWPIGDEM